MAEQPDHQSVLDQKEQWSLQQAGSCVGPFRVNVAAAVGSAGDVDEALAAAVAAVRDGPADRLRVGPVIANDDPEGWSGTALPRNGPGLTARAQLVCGRVQGATPRLQTGFGEVGQRLERLFG